MTKILILLLIPCSFAWASPAPFPVFLKAGFSSILEFEESPSRVVLGDGQNFQVEKLEHSLVIKTLAPYAVTNMFVYFDKGDTRLFVLTASEDAEPTYFKKFEAPKMPAPPPSVAVASAPKIIRQHRIAGLRFDEHKDYLSVVVELVANSQEALKPNWNLVRLTYDGRAIPPFKLWAERKEIQKDSRVKARFLFVKPNVPKDLGGTRIVVPLAGSETAISLALGPASHTVKQ